MKSFGKSNIKTGGNCVRKGSQLRLFKPLSFAMEGLHGF